MADFDTTFVIKTFDRPKCLTRLLASLMEHYPSVAVVIADDGKEQITVNHPLAKVVRLPFNVGLKAGRAAALREVATKYFVLLDDDFKVTPRLDLGLFISLLESHKLDLLGGDVLDDGTRSSNYRNDFLVKDHILQWVGIPMAENEKEVIPCDMVANFYIANTARFIELGGWDERLKIGGHEELFYRFKLKGAKIGWTNRVAVQHFPWQSPEYTAHRQRAYDYFPDIARREHKIYHETNWDVDFPVQNSNRHLRLKPGYQQREKEEYFDDTPNKDEWQKGVYEAAKRCFDANHYRDVIDIGCGSGYKLVTNFPRGSTIGLEVQMTVEFLRQTYPDRAWLLSDYLKFPTLTADIVICADVLEHVFDPTAMMRYMVTIRGVKSFFISTPDRDTVRGRSDMGPPANPYHLREWSQPEFYDFLSRFVAVMDLKIIDAQQGTMLAVCEL